MECTVCRQQGGERAAKSSNGRDSGACWWSGKAVDCKYFFHLEQFFWFYFGWIFFGFVCWLFFFCVFSLGGSSPFYLLYFGAKIFHLHAHLACDFWLMAFGLWLLALVSLGFGFTWLLAFGFWLLALAVGFTWLLAVFGFWFAWLLYRFRTSVECVCV